MRLSHGCLCLTLLSAIHGFLAPCRGQSPAEERRHAELSESFPKLERAGQYQQAASVCKQALALARRYEKPELQAHWLARLGNTQRRLGELNAAQASMTEALALYKRHDGPESRGVADMLINLSNLLSDQGKYPEAEQKLLESIPIFEKLIERETDLAGRDYYIGGLAASYSSLGTAYQEMGKVTQAESMYEKASTTFGMMESIDALDLATLCQNRGTLYYETGRLRDAEQQARLALDIYRKQLGEDHEFVGQVLNNLGLLLVDLADLEGALKALRQSVAIRERTFGRKHVQTLTAMESSGTVYVRMGRAADAEELLRPALALTEELLGPDHPQLISRLLWLASVEEAFGRREKAIALAERALKISEQKLGAKHPTTIYPLHHLADHYSKAERFREAEQAALRAVEIARDALGPEDPRTAIAHRTLAGVYRDQQQFQKAIPHYQRVLEIDSSRFSNNWRSAEARALLAETYVELGRFQEAEGLIEKALEILGGLNFASSLQYVHHIRARVRYGQGNPAALDDLRKAMDCAESIRSNLGGDEHGRAGGFARYSKSYALMVKWQTEMGNVAEAFTAMERSRARGLQDLMAVQAVDLLQGVPEQQASVLRAKEKAAKAAIAESDQRLALLPDRKDLSDDEKKKIRAELERQYKESQQQFVDAYAAIRRASPAYQLAVAQGSKPVSLERIEQLVRDQEALLVQYFLGEEACYVLVVSAAGSNLHEIELAEETAKKLGVEPGPLPADKLDAILTNEEATGVMQLLRRSQHDAQLKAAQDKLSALWQVLLPEHARRELTSGTLNRCFIIPDGALSSLPFETLVVEERGEPVYLLNAGPPTIYAPSATILVNLMDRKAARTQVAQPVLSVGDPAYAGNAANGSRSVATTGSRYHRFGGQLRRLPGSRTESAWVKQVFAKHGIETMQLQDRAATEAAVRRQVGQRRIVHLACHGLADRTFGNLFGALALAPSAANRSNSEDDGFLSLSEIYGLDLSGCELAILSACDTNFGPQQRGEGVWSLSRGFLVAGSRRVVASNWLVDDRSAASLISYFCSLVARESEDPANLQAATALQEAKRWVRQQPKWQSPYYWGTFVLLGAD